MRLIDADALAEKKFQERECNGLGEGPAYRQGWNDAIDAVMDNEPSAQPEIIRCRECKLRDTEYCNMAHGFMGMKDDDYCSYAERREVSE